MHHGMMGLMMIEREKFRISKIRNEKRICIETL